MIVFCCTKLLFTKLFLLQTRTNVRIMFCKGSVYMKFKKGEPCYFIVNSKIVVPAIVVTCSGGFCVIKFNKDGGIRLRESRLYKTEKEAYKEVPDCEKVKRRITSTNEYWMH